MPAVTAAVAPSLSQIQSWNTDHLTAAATYWTASATTWENAVTEVFQQMPTPGGRPWQGNAAEAAQRQAHSDRMKVIGVADELYTAAAVARLGADELKAAKQRVLSLIADARSAEFSVGEDLSVDYSGGGSVAAAAAKRAQALAYAADIRSGATELVMADQQIAAKLSTAAAGVSALNFPEAPPEIPKPEDPEAKSLSVRDAEDVHRIVDLLPPGKQPHVKVVPTPEALRGLFETLTTNSSPAPSSSYPGESRILEDGTRISYRVDSKSGGPTMDIVFPDGSALKVHTDDLPRPPSAPAPVPVPVAVPAPEPAPVPDSPAVELPSPTVGVPVVTPEDAGVLGTIGAIGIGILVGIGSFGKSVLSP